MTTLKNDYHYSIIRENLESPLNFCSLKVYEYILSNYSDTVIINAKEIIKIRDYLEESISGPVAYKLGTVQASINSLRKAGFLLPIKCNRYRNFGNREKNLTVSQSNENTRLKKLYNITYFDYIQIGKNQDNKCAICNETDTKKLFVDHCHKTGKVRGLLCHHCNSAIGFFKDDIKRLKKAIDYLMS